jgi:hypothetical protein
MREILTDESGKWSASRMYSLVCMSAAIIVIAAGAFVPSIHTYAVQVSGVLLGSAVSVLLGSAWKSAKVSAASDAPPDVPDAPPKRKYNRKPSTTPPGGGQVS